ncbi:MAG: pre-peptidase C-terminal domain-containing protein, partial [Chloroflexota bacterium]
MKKYIIAVAALALALSILQMVLMLQPSLQAQEDIGIRGGGTREMGQSVNGSIVYGEPYDRWTFQGTQGQLVVITMEASAGTLDPYLELLDPNGVREALNKDSGPGNAARISTPLLKSGQYTIVAKDVDSLTVGSYVLRLTDPAHLPNLSPGRSVRAIVRQAAFSDLYTFTGTADQGVILTVDSVGGLGLPYLELLGPNGYAVVSTSTTTCSPGVNQAMVRTLPSDGPYVVAVYDYWGATPGSYRLILSIFSSAEATGTPTAIL